MTFFKTSYFIMRLYLKLKNAVQFWAFFARSMQLWVSFRNLQWNIYFILSCYMHFVLTICSIENFAQKSNAFASHIGDPTHCPLRILQIMLGKNWMATHACIITWHVMIDHMIRDMLWIAWNSYLTQKSSPIRFI